MGSGWLVTYIDGETFILSERAFTEHEQTVDKESVESEVRYLDIRELIKTYPWLEVKE